MSGWTWFWLAWFGAFVFMEGNALANHTNGDTLSETVWRWLRIGSARNPGTVAWTWRSFVLAAFLVWLVPHLMFGWFAG